MATFVLCHGGWAGGWQWRTVPDLLRKNGHVVFTPTFTGLGERVHLAHPDIGLTTYVTDIVNVIQFEELYDVILVGYSFGGMVIGGVADRIPDRIAHLVYLDAFVPQDGQSLADLLGAEITTHTMEAVRQVGDGWKIPWLSDPGDPRMTPQPLKTATEPAIQRNPDALSLPRSFIYCPLDKDVMLLGRPIVRAAQAAKSDPTWHYYELQTDHGPIQQAPLELSELLVLVALRTDR
jgi:pimeloyl-ACP methyl ester carboxylesterase